jgi:hypothetical protein
MAFPFVFESNFETGVALDEWDSETDTAAQLDIAHYKELARLPYRNAAPSSGAFCMRLQLTGGTADAFLQEGDLNIALPENMFFKFDLYFSDDFTGTADDTFHLFETQGAANAIQQVLGARVVATTDVINLGIGNVAPTSFGTIDISKGEWYTCELDITNNAGAGTIDLFVTKRGDKASAGVHATQVGTLTNIAVTHGVLGIQNHLATTTGTMLIDNFIQDDARIFPKAIVNKEVILMTKSGHVFVGAGEVDNVSLLSGAGTDCVLSIFDTDEADIDDANNINVELKNTANNEIVDPAGTPVKLRRGAFVSMSGTTPRGLVKVKHVDTFGSLAAIRSLGRKS